MSNARSGWATGEGDTILGKGHQGAAVTLVERYSRDLHANVVPNKTAALVGSTVTELPAGVAGPVETLPLDHGSEFAGHWELAAKLAATVYLARPYCSCDRGLSEHTNGLLRGYVGKAENLREIDPERIEEAVAQLSPRRSLDYQIPYAVFSAACRAARVGPVWASAPRLLRSPQSALENARCAPPAPPPIRS